MSDQYIGEVRLFAFGVTPKGWLPCNGQLMSINQNAALFSLLGTVYGGDGRNTFGLPNLQGRVALEVGTGGGATYVQGELAGEVQHQLTISEMPPHTHTLNGNNAATGSGPMPAGGSLGVSSGPSGSSNLALYSTAAAKSTLATQSVGMQGGNLAHTNMMPYLTLNYCIAINGIFPSRS
jgi:microcystin-dependent protein